MDTVEHLHIETLAFTCPYIGGSAVYKARFLHSLFNPLAQYNDRLMCLQSANQNKTTNLQGYTNLDSLYEALANIEGAIQLNNFELNATAQEEWKQTSAEHNDILIYPNPASDFLYISNLQTTGHFSLFDMVGEVVYKIELESIAPLHKLNLPPLTQGVYSYQLITPQQHYFGKITIK